MKHYSNGCLFKALKPRQGLHYLERFRSIILQEQGISTFLNQENNTSNVLVREAKSPVSLHTSTRYGTEMASF